MNWRLYSFVVRGGRRTKILQSLESPRTPTQIGSIADISVSHVSKTLSEFKEKGIVECITPKERVGRIYKLTKKGQEILRHIKLQRGM